MKNSPPAVTGLVCLILFAFIVLLPQRQMENAPGFSSTLLVAQVKLRTAPPVQKPPFEIAYPIKRTDQTPQINPALLQVDLKQNLLVWPNIANDLTRSPPSAV